MATAIFIGAIAFLGWLLSVCLEEDNDPTEWESH